MPQTVTVKIIGLKELQAKLQTMSQKDSRAIVRQALREASKDVQKAFAEKAPKRTGFLASHFNVKLKVIKDYIAATAYIGPSAKDDYPLNAAGDYREIPGRKGKKPRKFGRISVESVARFIEFGVPSHQISANPFMRNTFESMRDALTEKIANVIKAKLKL